MYSHIVELLATHEQEIRARIAALGAEMELTQFMDSTTTVTYRIKNGPSDLVSQAADWEGVSMIRVYGDESVHPCQTGAACACQGTCRD